LFLIKYLKLLLFILKRKHIFRTLTHFENNPISMPGVFYISHQLENENEQKSKSPLGTGFHHNTIFII